MAVEIISYRHDGRLERCVYDTGVRAEVKPTGPQDEPYLIVYYDLNRMIGGQCCDTLDSWRVLK